MDFILHYPISYYTAVPSAQDPATKSPYMHPIDQGMMGKWANNRDKCVRQRTARQEAMKLRAKTHPLLNICETAAIVESD